MAWSDMIWMLMTCMVNIQESITINHDWSNIEPIFRNGGSRGSPGDFRKKRCHTLDVFLATSLLGTIKALGTSATLLLCYCYCYWSRFLPRTKAISWPISGTSGTSEPFWAAVVTVWHQSARWRSRRSSRPSKHSGYPLIHTWKDLDSMRYISQFGVSG